jgi:multicomponent Na+:H+ antiporter subunit C
MSTPLLALLVGVLLAAGVWLILRRGQVKLVLGLGLITHAVNLLIFGTGGLMAGALPIITDKEAQIAEISSRAMADPLPQALILTAIVISFGVTAFLVVLISRRDALTGADILPGELADYVNAADPLAPEKAQDLLSDASDDYDILQFELDELYDRSRFPVDEEA